VCDLYRDAPDLHLEGVRIVSTDEKTGIQALERMAEDLPMRPGSPRKREYDYIRHGTACLMANFEVATGRVISPTLGQTRTEGDYARHIEATVATDPQARWIIVNDQLNTHKSEALVRLVARLCGMDCSLGEKGVSGVLKDMGSRKAFLEDASHRICFLYPPKHCSWLNQVEIWLGILTKRLIKRGNFRSVDDLMEKIRQFVTFFNENLAKPYKWTYEGKPLKI